MLVWRVVAAEDKLALVGLLDMVVSSDRLEDMPLYLPAIAQYLAQNW